MSRPLAQRLGLLLNRSRFAQTSWLSKPNDEKVWAGTLADAIDLLAACLRSGLPLIEALDWVLKRSDGRIREEFTAMVRSVELGDSAITSLFDYERAQPDPHLRELAMKLALAEQLGTPVASQLSSLARALRASQIIQNRELAAKKEGRIMLPLVFLVLPVTVLFAVFPSIQFLQFQTI
jgi:tight adherence protein C